MTTCSYIEWRMLLEAGAIGFIAAGLIALGLHAWAIEKMGRYK